MTQFKNFIGIDNSKETLDLALITEHDELIELKLPNEQNEIVKSLSQLFSDYSIEPCETLICAEHTGHFGNKLINSVLQSSLNLWLESAYDIIHSQGLKRGKNDKVDALRIMEYAKRFYDKAIIYTPQSKSLEILQRLDSERNQIVKDISKYKKQLTQEKGFFDPIYFKQKEKRLMKLIKYNEKIMVEVEQKVDEIINNDLEIKTNLENILTIDGIGKRTALATIIATGNFTKFTNPRKFVCHAGCAPFKYESGSSISSKNRVSHRANKNLKRLYHMGAVSILRTKGELRQYFDRKVDAGKSKMSVINAIRAKLIHRVFAVVKQNRKYDKTYIHSLA